MIAPSLIDIDDERGCNNNNNNNIKEAGRAKFFSNKTKKQNVSSESPFLDVASSHLRIYEAASATAISGLVAGQFSMDARMYACVSLTTSKQFFYCFKIVQGD